MTLALKELTILKSCEKKTRHSHYRRRLYATYTSNRDELEASVRSNCDNIRKFTIIPAPQYIERGRLSPLNIIEVYELMTLCGIVVFLNVFDKQYISQALFPATSPLIDKYIELLNLILPRLMGLQLINALRSLMKLNTYLTNFFPVTPL
jgi:hypothetical protein